MATPTTGQALTPMSRGRVLGAAWKAILAAELALVVYGILALLFPDAMLARSYERFAGVAWPALQSGNPKTAEYISLSGRVIGGLNTAFGIVGVAAVVWGFRRGAKWAWGALLVGNAFGYGTPIAFDLTTGRVELFEYIEFALAALVLIALALSAGPIFGNRSRSGRA